MDSNLLRMNHRNWLLLPMNMARSRRCSDDAELRLPIKIIDCCKFVVFYRKAYFWITRHGGERKRKGLGTAGLLDVVGEAVQPKQGTYSNYINTWPQRSGYVRRRNIANYSPTMRQKLNLTNQSSVY
jgi:hypothetical protein